MSQNIHETVLIGDNVKLGDPIEIGPYVVIGNNIKIGKNVIIKPFCEIRDEAKIGNNVFIGSQCLIDDNTIVEDDVIMKHGSAATDTPKLGQDMKAPCHIKRKARIGANVTLMPGITIGENSEIGACSQVRHNVPDNEVWYGNPAKFFKKVE